MLRNELLLILLARVITRFRRQKVMKFICLDIRPWNTSAFSCACPLAIKLALIYSDYLNRYLTARVRIIAWGINSFQITTSFVANAEVDFELNICSKPSTHLAYTRIFYSVDR